MPNPGQISWHGLVALRMPIQIIESLDNGKELHHDSIVEDLEPDVLVAAMPIEKGVLVPLPEGTTVKVCFPRQGALYVCDTSVVSRVMEPLPCLWLAPPTDVRRVQRRQSFRLPLLLVPTEILVKVEDNVWEAVPDALILDISAGGLRLTSRQPMAVGTEMRVRFQLPLDNREIAATGVVVRSCDLGQRELRRYQMGVHFLHIRRGDQDAICRFIFRRQAEMRRQGVT